MAEKPVMGGMNRRSQYITNERFQYRFIALCLVPQIIGAVLFWFLLTYLFSELKGFGAAVGLAPNDQFYVLLDAKRSDFMTEIIGILGLYLILLFILALFFSHRVAGPLFKLNKYLTDGATSNDLKPLFFRPGDFFHETAEKLNVFLKAKGLFKQETPPSSGKPPLMSPEGDQFEVQ